MLRLLLIVAVVIAGIFAAVKLSGGDPDKIPENAAKAVEAAKDAVEEGAEATGEVAEDAANAVEEAAEETTEAVDEAVDEASDAVDEAVDETTEAVKMQLKKLAKRLTKPRRLPVI